MGGMNLFARSLGGIGSDVLFAKFGFPGRIWAQFLSLFFEAIFLFAFGCVSNEQPWYVALMVLICFSIFVQMSEGTSYGIVPFMNKQQLAVVSALVGAGGNGEQSLQVFVSISRSTMTFYRSRFMQRM